MRYFVITISVAIVTAFVAAALYFWLTMIVSNNEKQLMSDAQQIKSYGAIGDDLESLFKAKENLASRKLAVDRLTTRAPFKVDSLAEFSFLIPPGVWLTQLNYVRSANEIKLKGHASTESGASQFVDNLISSAKFTQVQQRSITKDPLTTAPSFTFVIDCKLGVGQ